MKCGWGEDLLSLQHTYILNVSIAVDLVNNFLSNAR
jgi:hypothetical protein